MTKKKKFYNFDFWSKFRRGFFKVDSVDNDVIADNDGNDDVAHEDNKIVSSPGSRLIFGAVSFSLTASVRIEFAKEFLTLKVTFVIKLFLCQ
jgi:hypothetical protein